MSVVWTGGNASLDADLGAGNEIDYSTVNVILGCYFRYNDDDTNDALMSLGDNAAETPTPQELSCVRIGTATAAQAGASDFLRVAKFDATDGVTFNQTGTAYTGDASTWNAVLLVIRGDADASLFVNSRANVTNNTGSRNIVGTGLRRVTCGETFADLADVISGCGVAEIFVGELTPTNDEIDQFFSGVSPGVVWPGLSFYDPLKNDAGFNTSKRIGPTPSIGGTSSGNATYDDAHPDINYGGNTAKRLLLMGVG